MSSVTSFTKAMLVQPLLLLQILMHSSGWAQATSSVKRTLAAIPGNIMMKRGRSLRYPARMQAPLAWLMSLLARARWTMTWSLHQYQMLDRVIPVIRPDQGRSPAPTSTGRNMWRKFS